MPEIEPLKLKVDESELEAFCNTLDALKGKLKDVDSTFKQSAINQPNSNNNSTFTPLAAGVLGGTAIGATLPRLSAFAAGSRVLGFFGGPGGIILTAVSIAIPLILEKLEEDAKNTPDINLSNFDLPNSRRFQPAVIRELEEASKETVFTLSDEDLKDILIAIGNQTATKVNLNDLLKELPDEALFFKPERVQKINAELEIYRKAQEAAEEAAKKLNQTGSESNQINKEQKEILDENTQGYLDVGDAQSTTAKANKESIKQAKALDKEYVKNVDGLQAVEVAYVDSDKAASDFGIRKKRIAKQS